MGFKKGKEESALDWRSKRRSAGRLKGGGDTLALLLLSDYVKVVEEEEARVMW